MAPKSKDMAMLDRLSNAEYNKIQRDREDAKERAGQIERLFRPDDKLRPSNFGPDVAMPDIRRALEEARRAKYAQDERNKMLFGSVTGLEAQRGFSYPNIGSPDVHESEIAPHPHSGPGSYGFKTAISPRLPRSVPIAERTRFPASDRLPPGSMVERMPTKTTEVLTDAEQAQLDYLLAKSNGMK